MLLSLLAVLAGFAAMALLVIISTAVAATLLLPGGMSPAAASAIPRPYLIANLGCSAVAAFAGGVITARIATSAPLTHGVALAALMVVMSIVSIRQAGGRQPRWYQVTLLTAMPAIAVAGAGAMGLWSRHPL